MKIDTLLYSPVLAAVIKATLLVLICFEVYFSLVNVESGVDIPHVDKFVHFGMHAVNISLAAFAFFGARSYRFALIALLLLGPAIEFMQYFTPSRTAAWDDQLANSLGALAGFLVGHIVRLRRGVCRRLPLDCA